MGSGRISDEYTSAAGRRAGGQYELASTSHNQLAHLFEINRTYDFAHRPRSQSRRSSSIWRKPEHPAAHGEYIAGAIPGARLVLVPGGGPPLPRNYGTPVVDEVEQFVTGRRTLFADRMRTTMLFTDIVDSTPLAASIGDVLWSALIDEHNERVHRQVVAYGGHEVKSTGDGFLVAFGEPGRRRSAAHWRPWGPFATSGSSSGPGSTWAR